MAERSAGCTLKTEQRVNEEASYEKATVRKQKFRVIVYNFSLNFLMSLHNSELENQYWTFLS